MTEDHSRTDLHAAEYASRNSRIIQAREELLTEIISAEELSWFDTPRIVIDAYEDSLLSERY